MPKADSWTVTLRWPPSTNRIWRNVAVSDKPRTLLSQEGRVYRKAAADACLVAKLAGKQIPDRLALRLVVQAPDRRARDLDNTVKAVQDALTHAWEVLAEPIQTVMRRYGVQGAYEKLKEVTRGKTVRAEDLHALIVSLEIPQADKDRLLAMTPASYIGKAAELARRV